MYASVRRSYISSFERVSKLILAVAFDLDDTLYPEQEYVFSGYRAVSEVINNQVGLQVYDDLVDLFQSGKHARAFELALRARQEDVTEAYLLSLVEVYRRHEPNLNPFPEVTTVLKKLKTRYRLALISDGVQAVQKRKLAGLKIEHVFDAVVFSDQWGRNFWKPHPRPYEECARKLA